MAALSERLGFEGLLPQMTERLSTGQRQRVALAAALLHEPELLFLDEPTGGVDPKGRRLFWDLIYELAAERGMTVLVTTHYMDEAEQCDRLAFILDGKLIASGTPHELKTRCGSASSRCRPASDPFAALASVQGEPSLEDAYLFGRRLRAVAGRGRAGRARSSPASGRPLRRAVPRGRVRVARPERGARAARRRSTMKRLLALVRKEFLQLRRDTITLRMIVMVPILQTLIFGYAINYDVKHLKTVVLDEASRTRAASSSRR